MQSIAAALGDLIISAAAAAVRISLRSLAAAKPLQPGIILAHSGNE